MHHLSERRACRLVGLSRDSYRHPPEADQATLELSAKIVEIAHARRRFGYRRIHDMLRSEFPGVNHKRVYRLYSEANLTVRKRRKVKRPSAERMPLQIAKSVNEVWSMDFVSDSLANGRRIKCLTVADDFSHECVDITADYGISGQYVTRLLDRAATFRGYPRAVRTDNGPEFTCRAFMAWAHGHGIEHILTSSPVDRCRTATSKASTASSGTSASMSNGSRPCTRLATLSPPGGRTTTRSGRTAASDVCLRLDLPSCIASALAMQLEIHQPPRKSTNLATPDFDLLIGMAIGGRSMRTNWRG